MRDGNRVEGALLVTVAPREVLAGHAVLGDDVRKLADDMSSTDLIACVGSFARYYGGGVVARHMDLARSEEVLEELVKQAIVVAEAQTTRMIAPNVPHEQVPAFTRAGFEHPKEALRRVWHEVILGGARDEKEFLDGLRANCRRTWRQDLTLTSANGILVDIEKVTPEAIPAFSRLISDVRFRHGESSHPILVEYEVGRRSSASNNDLIAFLAKDRRGSLLGVLLGATVDDALELYDVGLVEHTSRSEVYRAIVFAEPLRYALRNRLSRIVLGSGHDRSKALRGSQGAIMYGLARSKASRGNTLRSGDNRRDV
ncbi:MULTISPECIES: hypothetical protein [unclassified Microbacterium]|uniref:hypothetical protein n=1 Tax=unclassified Microbacterium TaxID=2609290 RepID=UPI0011B0E8DE|nr:MULTISPECIES: hypothetical protein [unclassified Microbacterium]